LKRTTKNKIEAICAIAILLFTLSIDTTSLAEGEFRARDGSGWDITDNGVLTIENNDGWQDYLRNGSYEVINKLVIGNKLTEFYLFDCNTQEYMNSDIECPWFQPKQIEVEEGNPVFVVENGLLINTKNNTVTSSELWVKDVVIPEGIQTIGAYAFFRRSVETIRFSSALEKIEAFTFSDCENLKALIFPSALNWIGEYAFSGCTSVSEIQFSNNLGFIGEGAFDYCSIRELVLPESVLEIGSQAFKGCDWLKIVRLPAHLEGIRYRLFYGCTNLTEINLPEGLETIGEEAFLGCENLKEVSLPETLGEIGEDAFQDLDFGLVEFPDTLKVGDSAFGRIHVAVFTGSNYEFSARSIEQVDIMLFLDNPPQGISKLNADSLFPKVYYTEPFADAWKAGVTNGLNGWPTMCISLEEADDLIAQAVATPQPTEEPSITTDALGSFSNTPEPSIQPETDAGTDPLVYVFAGLIALVIAAVVIIGVKSPKNRGRNTVQKKR